MVEYTKKIEIILKSNKADALQKFATKVFEITDNIKQAPGNEGVYVNAMVVKEPLQPKITDKVTFDKGGFLND